MSADTHITFDHHKSSTFRLTRRPFRILYGSGMMNGVLAYDTVRVTWKQKLNQICTNQPPPGPHRCPMLGQNWLWSDHCLHNRCRTSWQGLSFPNSPCQAFPLSWPFIPSALLLTLGKIYHVRVSEGAQAREQRNRPLGKIQNERERHLF